MPEQQNPAADWYADPLRRDQYRYWDGAQWTQHVADEGVASVDALEATAETQAAGTDAGGHVGRPAGWPYCYGPSGVRMLASEGDVAGLIEILGNVDVPGDTRSEAASALGTMSNPIAVPVLVRALKDRQSPVRTAAAVALGCIADARAVQPLIEALGDEVGGARTAAADALARIGDPRAAEPIAAALRISCLVGTYKPAPALTQFGVRAVEPLIAVIRDGTPLARHLAAEALTQIRDSEAVEPLVAALRDEDQQVRTANAEALHALGSADAVEAAPAAEEAARPLPGLAAESTDARVAQEAAAFVALLGDDHRERQQAIAALLDSGYRDPEESRGFANLGRSPGVEYSQDELRKDVETHSDFDIAYVRAAYPTGRAEDHAHADISLLREGLPRCTVKARLLARLCNYYAWKGESLKALDWARRRRSSWESLPRGPATWCRWSASWGTPSTASDLTAKPISRRG